MCSLDSILFCSLLICPYYMLYLVPFCSDLFFRNCAFYGATCSLYSFLFCSILIYPYYMLCLSPFCSVLTCFFGTVPVPQTLFSCCLLLFSCGRSPAFGELSDTHFFRFLVGSREDRRAMWGEAPIAPEEIFETFASYIEGRIPKLVSPCSSVGRRIAGAGTRGSFAKHHSQLATLFYSSFCGLAIQGSARRFGSRVCLVLLVSVVAV